MELHPYVARLQQEVAAAAQPGGEAAEELAGRLLAPLHPAIRLLLLDVVSAAAAEVTRELAPASVEVRLRDGDPELVVVSPPGVGPGEAPPADLGAAAPGAPIASDDDDDGAIARINLRLPDALKRRVEQAAEQGGISINSWLVRAVAASLSRDEAEARGARVTARGGQSYAGWGR